MKIPAKKLAYRLYKNNKPNNEDTRAIFDMLLTSNALIDIKVDELINMYIDNPAPVIIDMLKEYASGHEIYNFINHTVGLVDDEDLMLLQRARQRKLNENVGGYEINK